MVNNENIAWNNAVKQALFHSLDNNKVETTWQDAGQNYLNRETEARTEMSDGWEGDFLILGKIKTVR